MCVLYCRNDEALALHEHSYMMGVEQLGMAHPYAQLARSNLVDALEEIGRKDDARYVMHTHTHTHTHSHRCTHTHIHTHTHRHTDT